MNETVEKSNKEVEKRSDRKRTHKQKHAMMKDSKKVKKTFVNDASQQAILSSLGIGVASTERKDVKKTKNEKKKHKKR